MRLAEASSPGTKEDRKDRRVLETQTGKRQVVVVAREHKGRTLTFVVAKEADAVKIVRERVASGTIVHADEAAGRDALHASYDTKRINHSIAYRLDVACANQAESFFRTAPAGRDGAGNTTGSALITSIATQPRWLGKNITAGRKRNAVERGAGVGPAPPDQPRVGWVLAAA